jgi:hypothetical protein
VAEGGARLPGGLAGRHPQLGAPSRGCGHRAHPGDGDGLGVRWPARRVAGARTTRRAKGCSSLCSAGCTPSTTSRRSPCW